MLQVYTDEINKGENMNNKKDEKLYHEYLNGNAKSFEKLYLFYKNRIKHFIFNIIKDSEISEDITQEVFLYILKNPLKENYKFKYYIFLVAKSRAYSFISGKKRRQYLDEKYMTLDFDKVEKDTSEIIIEKEKNRELKDAINMLDDRYKNAVYLSQIEGFSYKEVSEIMRRIA